MRSAVLAFAAVALSACGSPPPRDATYFEAHPEEADKVMSACSTGHRGNECENARRGQARANANARMERYRKGFE